LKVSIPLQDLSDKGRKGWGKGKEKGTKRWGKERKRVQRDRERAMKRIWIG
jgi:hypothetical protein